MFNIFSLKFKLRRENLPIGHAIHKTQTSWTIKKEAKTLHMWEMKPESQKLSVPSPPQQNISNKGALFYHAKANERKDHSWRNNSWLQVLQITQEGGRLGCILFCAQYQAALTNLPQFLSALGIQPSSYLFVWLVWQF